MAALAKPAAKVVPKRRALDEEIEAIQKLMREDRRAYNADPKLQSRYLALLEQRGQLPARAEPEAGGQGDGSGLPQELLNEWETQGGIQHHLTVARATVQAIDDALDEQEATRFQESFDRLPEAIQTSVYRYIAIDGTGGSRPASDQVVQEFASLNDECGALVSSWGDKAPRLLGIAKARIDTIMRSLSDKDRAAAQDWLDGLSPREQVAVIKALSGSA
jgi:hypothetical protein